MAFVACDWGLLTGEGATTATGIGLSASLHQYSAQTNSEAALVHLTAHHQLQPSQTYLAGDVQSSDLTHIGGVNVEQQAVICTTGANIP